MSRSPYEEEVEVRVFAPAAPAVVWGALMAVALIGAGATVLRSHAENGSSERLVTTTNERGLQRDVDRLAAERNELAGRLASLERSFGELKLASRADGAGQTARSQAGEPETVGALNRPADAPAQWTTAEPGAIGVVIGRDGTLDEIRRRWSAVSARAPQQLAKLIPRAQRAAGATGLVALVAGPFANHGEAERACAALAEQGLACDTTGYAGAPLGRP